jgi:Xaa-Pro aminopeptidase
MSTDNQLETESTTQTVDAENKGEVTSVELTEKIKSLENQLKDAINTRDKAKQKSRELEEAAAYKTKFEELNAQFEVVSNELNGIKESAKTEKVNTALQTALEAAGAKSLNTVLKLIDKSQIQFDEQGQVVEESVVNVVKAVMDSDPILFGEADPKKAQSGLGFLDPGVKRAGEGGNESAYLKELRSAKNQKEIQAVMKKYKIIQ